MIAAEPLQNTTPPLKRRRLMVKRNRERRAAWEKQKKFGLVSEVVLLVRCVVVDRDNPSTKEEGIRVPAKVSPSERGHGKYMAVLQGIINLVKAGIRGLILEDKE